MIGIFPYSVIHKAPRCAHACRSLGGLELWSADRNLERLPFSVHFEEWGRGRQMKRKVLAGGINISQGIETWSNMAWSWNILASVEVECQTRGVERRGRWEKQGQVSPCLLKEWGLRWRIRSKATYTIRLVYWIDLCGWWIGAKHPGGNVLYSVGLREASLSQFRTVTGLLAAELRPLPNFLGWSPDPQDLRMWLHMETGL